MLIGNGCESCQNNTVTKNNWFCFVQAGLPHTPQVFEGEAGNEMKKCCMVRGIVAPGLVFCAVPDGKSSSGHPQSTGRFKLAAKARLRPHQKTCNRCPRWMWSPNPRWSFQAAQGAADLLLNSAFCLASISFSVALHYPVIQWAP